MSEEFEITERSRVQLFGARSTHRKDDVFEAIDSCLYGTVAYSIGSQPYATPTMIWRQGEYLYWHGSAGSRMLKTVASGCNVSVTFVHVDGFVLSRLASAHAMNYRSVMVFGNAEPVEDLAERRNQLKFFLSRLFPGRWDEVKQPSLDELEGIIMVRMRIQEGSLKKRAGLPGDGRPAFGGEQLYQQVCWAGTLPIENVVGSPADANRLHESIGVPNYIADFAGRFGMKQSETAPDWIQARVVDARLAATRIKVLRLAATSGRFPATDAGAHLEVGVVLRDRLKDWREYTIVAHDPKGRWLEIAVLRDDKGRGGSLFMHDEVHPGSEVRVRIPENDFRLDRSAVHSILIAGGIGITPILAMARELDRTNSSAEAHYSARGRDAAAFLHELEELPLVNCKFYDTSAGALARMDLTKVIGDYRVGTHVYVCGPQQLIDQTYRIAEELGYPAEALHSEAFAAPSAKLSDATIEVKFARSGKTTNVQPGQTLLDAALAEGISVSYSCKRGECGLCVTEVLEGQPDHRDRFLKPNEKPGKICLCVSWVSSPTIVLDA